MKKPAKLLVKCPRYDNKPADVLFMMEADDFRLHDERYAKEYVILAPAQYNHKSRTLTTATDTYKVFSDWSLRKI